MAERGTYIKMSDSLPEHRKIIAAGGDAAWLHVCAMAYASRNLTDGLIPAGYLPQLSDRRQPVKLAGRLCDVNLWHQPGHDCDRCAQPPDGQYVIHDYLEHQRSAERVAEVSSRRAASGRVGGSRSKAKPKQIASGLPDVCSDSAEANAKPSFTEEVLRTSQAETEVIPAKPAASARADSAVTAGTLVAEWIRACKKRPPDRVIGQVSSELKKLLDEGQDAADVHEGLEAWRLSAKHPSTLASFVNAAMNPGATPQRNGHQPYRNPTDQSVYDRGFDDE